MRVGLSEVWRAMRTPDGPATFYVRSFGFDIRAEAWGPGADWALDHAPGMIGATDDASGFEPQHDVIAQLWRDNKGIRITRTGGVMQVLIPTILEQKVTGTEARRAYRQLVMSTSGLAPGDVGLYLPPDPDLMAETPYFAFHPWGVEQRRAETVRAACAQAARLEAAAALPLDMAKERLGALPGVGPWTVAEVVAPGARRRRRRVGRRLPPAGHRVLGTRRRSSRRRRPDARAAGALPGTSRPRAAPAGGGAHQRAEVRPARRRSIRSTSCSAHYSDERAAVPEGLDPAPDAAADLDVELARRPQARGQEQDEALRLDALPFESVGRRLGGRRATAGALHAAPRRYDPHEQQSAAFADVAIEPRGRHHLHADSYRQNEAPRIERDRRSSVDRSSSVMRPSATFRRSSTTVVRGQESTPEREELAGGAGDQVRPALLHRLVAGADDLVGRGPGAVRRSAWSRPSRPAPGTRSRSGPGRAR